MTYRDTECLRHAMALMKQDGMTPPKANLRMKAFGFTTEEILKAVTTIQERMNA